MESADPTSEAVRLISSQRWIALATVDPKGATSISYAPFAPVRGAFGIVVSRLAAHTANLLALRPASILLVDDDFERRDAYARSRFSIGVMPRVNERGSPAADAVWSALEALQGETVRILRTLPDFEAISLHPQSGRLILGFASAYDIAAETIQEALR